MRRASARGNASQRVVVGPGRQPALACSPRRVREIFGVCGE